MRSIPQPYRRIWLIILAALVVVPAVTMAIVIAIGLIMVWWKPGADDVAFTRGVWHSTNQGLIASSMQVKPVPGWRANLADFGLPDTGSAAPYRFANDTNPFLSGTFIGNLDDRAYFMIGNVGAPVPQWSLVAINVADGSRIFGPLPLVADHARPRCYLNGPDAILCLTDHGGDTTAWVIDSHNGTVTYNGPTSLAVYSPRFIMEQVGIYAVAMKQDTGIFGVGPTAETTWFVPGNGTINSVDPDPPTPAPPTLTDQPAGRGAARTITFSPKDGTVIRPAIGDREQQEHTSIYPGGFAAEISGPELRSDIRFFDDAGARVGQNSPRGQLSGASGLPLVNLSSGGWALFDTHGDLLIQQPTPGHVSALVIRDVLIVTGDGAARRQFDMASGTEMHPCELPDGYFASDGRVALGDDRHLDTGNTLKAVDVTSCNVLWTLTSPPGSFRRVWRINTTLVQLSDDGTELMSLVAPA